MSTSGTIGLTRINTAKLIEKATRRCGLTPQILTPEIVESARESLFMLLTSINTRGLNLWCVDRKLIPLIAGQKTYVLPQGTTDVLNLMYCYPSRPDYTLTSAPTTYSTSFTDPQTPVRLGVRFSTLPTAPVLFQSSSDGLNWTTQATIPASDLTLNTYSWYPLDPLPTALHFRLSSAALGAPTDMYLATTIREIPVTPFNRDDYSSQPNKDFLSGTVTNYWFEKLVDPQITLWPVPNDATRHLNLYRYRQIEDVGTLTEELELPMRWYEPISWHLAARLAFEIPSVQGDRRAEVTRMASSMTLEVEGAETDNAPTFFAPNIGVYTR